MQHFVFLAFLALFFAVPAHAGTASTDARAQVLKGQLEGFLETQKKIATRHGCKLETGGDITVEKAGSYYALTLPHITYTDAVGIRSEIGMIAVNAIPEGNDNWKVSIAMPTPINSFNKQGTAQFKTDIGTQNANGVWNERLGHFTSLNATYGNLRFHDVMDNDTLTIANAVFTSALTEKDTDVFTGTAKATFDNISFQDTEARFNAALPRIVLNTNLADRASKTPMTKQDVMNRPQSSQIEAFNIFAFLFGAPERVVADVTGLQGVNMQIQQSLLTAPPQARQKLFAAVAGVSAVDAMGKPTKDPSTKSYDILFGADGSIALNGTDMSGMLTQPAAGTPAKR